MYRTGFWIFVIAASTDWIDGYLARRWNAETRWGAILDPIADKILVTGAILGVLTSGSVQQIIIPCGLILFREFAVSALRETMAGRIELPVTLAAKWKTTLQMVALGCQLFARNWDGWGLYVRLPAPLPAVLRRPDLAGRHRHPVDRLAVFQRGAEADAGSVRTALLPLREKVSCAA